MKVEIKFVADCNVGKLARWLRMMGYDTSFFRDIDDGQLIGLALREGRVVLTKDTELLRRKAVTSGRVKLVLLQGDDPKEQLHEVVEALNLGSSSEQAFTRCLECNASLEPRTKDEVRELVPPYVFCTQSQYMQCPSCHRVYWRGTHWERMTKELKQFEL
jgi:uncharacterized protein with PIN domain